jgi:TonB dependent receptor/Carboxypeptidase regulatory-like domain/TonB-dependent Receptor Plug Domain
MPNMVHVVRAALISLLIAFVPRTAIGQSLAVSGRVTDDTGAVLPGVLVQLREEGSKPIATATTNNQGRYELRANQAGRYQVRFSLISFSSVLREVTPATNGTTDLDVVLSLALTAEVTVTGHRTFRNFAEVDDRSRSLIGIANAASEGAVTARQLEGRPLSRPGEVLETVPGLVVSQHSGEGKANQYYLRGFNLDHGTDFAVSVAGIPVNMPTHGHAQGWSDVNFLIPELVSGVQFKKGPYYADEADFSTAGAANINYVNALERPMVRLTTGSNHFGRLLAAASPRVASGNLLLAVEMGSSDGPWDNPENSRRLNGVARYSRGDTRQAFAVTFMGYDAKWTATDQVPQRAVSSDLISRFGTLDPSDGGKTHRYTLSAEIQRSDSTSMTRVIGFAMDYGLDLFSNFTYRLNDPVNGDQFEQIDNRRVFGIRSTHLRRTRILARPFEHGVGLQLRHDRIGPVGLFATRERRRLSVTREDRVHQTSTGLYYQGELELTERLRVTSGIRGDLYHFDVRSSTPANTGTESAGLVSPKLGIVFATSTIVELYGNFGYGFHSNDARGTTITIDPATRRPAERVTPLVRTRGAEFGVRSILIPKLQTTLAVWGLTLDSELVFVGDAGTTEAGRPSRRIGVEWANYYSPRRWLTLDADMSWSRARFTDEDEAGSEIPGAVRQVASAGLSVSGLRRFSGGLRIRYVGPRPIIEDGSVQAKRSLLVNAEAGYRVAPGMSLVIDVLNLFDSRASDIDYYYPSRLSGEPAAGVEDVHTHPLAPRTARVNLRLDF